MASCSRSEERLVNEQRRADLIKTAPLVLRSPKAQLGSGGSSTLTPSYCVRAEYRRSRVRRRDIGPRRSIAEAGRGP